MTSSELMVAGIVEALLKQQGNEPGTRTPQDGKNDPSLTVDFTYDDQAPGLALEVTGLYRGEDLAAQRPADELAERLSSLSESEGLGCWLVTVRTEAQIKDLYDPVVQIMRELASSSRLSSVRPGWYTSQDLVRSRAAWGRHGPAKFKKAHEIARALGIVEVTKVEDAGSVVGVLPITDAVRIEGFADLLDQAIADNAAKLGRARPRQTHLAVLVNRFDASRFPTETPIPRLFEEVDVLWVIHRWHNHLQLPKVWWATRGSMEWSLADDPPDSATPDTSS
jgi:hypothetical protein